MKNILTEADKITAGKRQNDYGHPFINHSHTAKLWQAYFEDKMKPGAEFTPEDVCWFNILQKLSRETYKNKRDNKVDIAGYVRNIEIIEEYRNDNPPNKPTMEGTGLVGLDTTKIQPGEVRPLRNIPTN